MRHLYIVFTLLCWSEICVGQSRSNLPELNFDRRSDTAYMDSLLTISRLYLWSVDKLPRTLTNDTLRLEGLRFMTSVFKQTRGVLRDSSYVYARKLEEKALLYRNTLFRVRGLMQQEYYLRVVKTDYPKALRINQQVLALCGSLPRESSPKWQVQMNLGDIHVLLKDYEQALASYSQSLALLTFNTSLTPKNRKLLNGQVTTQIGEVYEIQGQFEKARKQYEASRRIALETNSKTNVAYADERLGDFFISRNQPEQAIYIFEEGLSVWTSLHDRVGQASIWARLAECYALINQPARALDFGEKALNMARESGHVRIQETATHALYMAYRRSDRPAQALVMYEQYVVLRDSLATLKRIEELSGIQKRYDIQQVKDQADKQQFLQQQQLIDMRRQGELAQLRSETERNKVAGETRLSRLKQWMETEHLRADSQKTRLEQRARIDALSRDIERQHQTRAVLIGGLAMILLFGLIYFRKSRLIARQKQQIEYLNRGLEDKVAERTAELKAANDQLRAKNREIEDALLRGQTLERKRMAADLHDNLGGLLAAIRLSLSALNPAGLTDREQQIYQSLLGMIKEAYAEVRYLSHNLQPDELEQQGLAQALARLIQKLNMTQQITFRLEDDELIRLDKITEFNLYSICIELCSNILRHSEATQADILFRQFNQELNMIVKDNGCGMDPKDATGMGLRNIQSRMDLIKGRYEVHSGPGEGTTFIFILPASPNLATA